MQGSRFVEDIIHRQIKDEELQRLLVLHSECVARKSVDLARRLGINDPERLQFIFDAAMLHDIGIVKCNAPSIHCHGKLPYICHGVAGAEILRAEGLDERYCRICERHTGSGLTAKEIAERDLPLPRQDFVPETLEEKIVCYADKFFSKSGDPAKEKSLERVEASMCRHGEASLERFLTLKAEVDP
ncbi:MAG: HDIG domain-containing protein [Muribaculaceae bacterium]|nr:HDIG domain-containing protein [Muribaculaceae bacterium]